MYTIQKFNKTDKTYRSNSDFPVVKTKFQTTYIRFDMTKLFVIKDFDHSAEIVIRKIIF